MNQIKSALIYKFNGKSSYSQKEIIDSFRSFGDLKNAMRLESCGSVYSGIRVFCASCYKKKRITFRCNNRFCVVCNWKKGMSFKRLLLSYKFVNSPKLLSLTVDMPLTLSNLVLVKSYLNKLFHRKVFKNVRGGLVVFQVGERGGKLHIHLLLDSVYIPQRLISSNWASISGFPIVDIRLVDRNHGINYVCRYVTRPMRINVSDMPVFVNDFYRKRFYMKKGSIFFHKSVSVSVCFFCGCSDFLIFSDAELGYSPYDSEPPDKTLFAFA